MEKVKDVLVQEFKFNLKGTKAMTKAGFIKSWKEQKEANIPVDSEGKKLNPKGRYGRFDPEKAWDELFPAKK
jgi:hypothetical protein